MMTNFVGTLFVSSFIALAGATGEAVTSTDVFEGAMTVAGKGGATQQAQISVRAWRLPRQQHEPQAIPLEGFYIAHLLSGSAASVQGGVTTPRLAGDYWTVKAGETMALRVQGDLAVVETIIVKRQ